jgi:UDP-N-acetylglucosamine acyltransferase
LRRRGYTDQQVMNIEDTYRIIYVQNNNITNALQVAELELPVSEEKSLIVDFIKASTKGIMRGLG